MELKNTILDHYFAHADKLSHEKRFHLANRIACWTGDPRALKLLAQSKDWLLPAGPGQLDASLQAAQKEGREKISKTSSLELRKPYFQRYPNVVDAGEEIFRVHLLASVYGLDARPALLRRHHLKELRTLEQTLLADQEALRVLSTWGVNYIFTFRKIILQDDSFDREVWLALGKTFSLQDSDPDQLRLYIYLYTHCIIADSLFYTQHIPKVALPTYHKMLTYLETIIQQRFTEVSLDTKFEFLVCCKICNFETFLAKKIHQECQHSLSPDGSFVIDTENVFARNSAKTSFENSEHRNILYVMSTTPYSPRSILQIM